MYALLENNYIVTGPFNSTTSSQYSTFQAAPSITRGSTSFATLY